MTFEAEKRRVLQDFLSRTDIPMVNGDTKRMLRQEAFFSGSLGPLSDLSGVRGEGSLLGSRRRWILSTPTWSAGEAADRSRRQPMRIAAGPSSMQCLIPSFSDRVLYPDCMLKLRMETESCKLLRFYPAAAGIRMAFCTSDGLKK